MAYPGVDYEPLAVDVGDMTVVDTHTTFTASVIVSNTIYRKGITINGAGVVVTATNCWFYRADPANPPEPIRLLNGGKFVGTKVKVGYDGTVVSGFDPIGGTHDPADYECRSITSAGGEIDITEFLFTHVEEGPTLQEERALIDFGVVGPFYVNDSEAHSDAFQSTGFADADVTRVRIRAEHVAGSLTEKSIQAFQIATSFGDIDRIYVDDCFISWNSVNAINGDELAPYTIGELVFINNVFDADSDDNNKTQDPFGANINQHVSTRFENRWSDDSSLIPNDRVAGGSVTAASVGTPNTAGSTTTAILTLPSAAVVGQIIVVDLFSENSQAVAGTTDWTPPAADDWSLLFASDGSLSNHDHASFWRPVKVGDTAGSTSFTFTCGSGDPVVGAIDLLEDLDTGTPFGTPVEKEQGTQENPATSAGVTTSEANTLVRVSMASREGVDGFSATTPATQDERFDFGSGRRLAVFAFTQASAGATGTLEYDMGAIQRYGIVAYVVNSASAGTTHDASAALTGTGSVAGTAAREANASASLSGSASIAASAAREANATASLSGSASVAATAIREANASASLVGAGSLAGAAVRETFASAALVGVGVLAVNVDGADVPYLRPEFVTRASSRIEFGH